MLYLCVFINELTNYSQIFLFHLLFFQFKMAFPALIKFEINHEATVLLRKDLSTDEAKISTKYVAN